MTEKRHVLDGTIFNLRHLIVRFFAPEILIQTKVPRSFFLTHLSFEYRTINKLRLSFECDILHPTRGPVPQDAKTLLLLLLRICNPSIISVSVLEIVPLTQGYIKEPPFPH
jgi:hypothetical protein